MAAEKSSLYGNAPMPGATDITESWVAGSTAGPDLTLLDLVELATSDLPVDELIQRLPECLATMMHCRFCGVAARQRTNEEEVFLRLSHRDEAGAWGAWNDASKQGDNGGAITEYVLAKSTRMVVNDWKNAPFRDICLEQKGIASAVVFPLSYAGVHLGTLGVYDHLRRSFQPDEIRYVEAAASLLARAMEDDRLDRRFVSAVAMHMAERDVSDAALAVLSRDMHLVQANRAFETISGFTLAELDDRTFVSALCDPEDEPLLRGVFAELQPGESPRHLECGLLTKHGVKKRVAWSFVTVQLPDSQTLTLASGIDVTERYEALQRAERAEAKAKSNLDSLLTLKTAIETGDIVQVRHVMYDVVRPKDANDPNTAPTTEPAAPPPAAATANRRQHARGAFRTIQRLAPFIGGKIPAANAFFEVSCRDLSAGGVSFFLREKPTAAEYLIALGTPENAILMSVAVCNCRQVEEQGTSQYLVGCKFLERVEA